MLGPRGFQLVLLVLSVNLRLRFRRGALSLLLAGRRKHLNDRSGGRAGSRKLRGILLLLLLFVIDILNVFTQTKPPMVGYRCVKLALAHQVCHLAEHVIPLARIEPRDEGMQRLARRPHDHQRLAGSAGPLEPSERIVEIGQDLGLCLAVEFELLQQMPHKLHGANENGNLIPREGSAGNVL